MTYRRGQSIVEALRVHVWDEEDRNVEHVAEWAGGVPTPDGVKLGDLIVPDGDWIVRTALGMEWQPADQFAMLYEPV